MTLWGKLLKMIKNVIISFEKQMWKETAGIHSFSVNSLFKLYQLWPDVFISDENAFHRKWLINNSDQSVVGQTFKLNKY